MRKTITVTGPNGTITGEIVVDFEKKEVRSYIGTELVNTEKEGQFGTLGIGIIALGAEGTLQKKMNELAGINARFLEKQALATLGFKEEQREPAQSIQVPVSGLPTPKKTFFIFRWFNEIALFLLYLFLGKFFIQRNTIKQISNAPPNATGALAIKEIEKTDYYNVSDKKFYKSPKNTPYVGFLSGAWFVSKLRKKYSNQPQYEFSLITIQDVAFIHHVTGGSGATTKDFR